MDPSLSLMDLLSIAKRRYLYLLIPFFLVLLGSILTAIILPAVYQSSGMILIESQQIPAELIQSTITSSAKERIEIIKQRVLTRANLLKIINERKLYRNFGPTYSNSERVERLRENIAVAFVNAEVDQNRRRSTTIAFTVSFAHNSATVARDVTNELITLFLEANVESRTSRAAETTSFLESESGKLAEQLLELENRIAGYKQENRDALPEMLETNFRLLERAHEELTQLLHGSFAPPGVTVLSPSQELARLEATLGQKSAIYSDSHPEIKSLKRKITSLRNIVANTPNAAGTETSGPDTGSVTTRQEELEKRIAALERSIARTPEVEHGLLALSRDYDTATKKYQEIRTKQMSAELAENLEREEKGERFALLEPPQLPESPVEPNRPQIIILGFFAACAAAFGSVFAIESIDGSIRNPEALARILHTPPLVVIPYISTSREIRHQWFKLVQALAVTAILLVLGALVFRSYLIPLGETLTSFL